MTSINHNLILVLCSLQRLIAGDVIPPLPSSVQETWDTGRSFVEGKTAAADGYPVHSEWLYTCDTSGKEITSEIRPL